MPALDPPSLSAVSPVAHLYRHNVSTLYEPWADQFVQGVADVLGHTSKGLSGKEIGQLLAAVRAPDPHPSATKRDRLRVALLKRQAQDRAANCVIAFITHAMAPVNYREAPQLFTWRQDSLNEVLVYLGLRVNDQGQLASGRMAWTLSEAAQHANSLRAELRRRGTHQAILAYCTSEILAKNAFHASLEATKGVAQRLRDLTGEVVDGGKLVDTVLALGKSGQPLLAINSLTTETERDEQTGFANLLKGLFGLYRNPVAHDPRLKRTVTDDELLELLTTLSMVHRRLDQAIRATRPPTG